MSRKVTPHPKPSKPRHFIRAWRKYRGLTQERLAERIEATAGLISQLETGETNYTQQTLEALAYALDAEPGDLISRDPNMEGSIIDLTRLLSAASDTERKRALRVLKEILGTGTDG